MAIRSVVWAIDNNDQGALPAQDARQMIASMLGTSNNAFTTSPGAFDRAHGVCGLADLAVTERGAGANMSVDVGIGRALVRSANSGGGSYFSWNDSTVNLPLAAADGANPRKDLVILQVRDSNEGDASDLPRLYVVTGSPNVLATVPGDTVGDPSLAAFPRAMVLARVHVPAGDTSITNSQIVDYRRFIPNAFTEIRCTSTTRPTGFDGLRIYETDTKRTWRHNGSIWTLTGGPVPRARCYRTTTQVIPNISNVVVLFDAELYDTDGFHSTSSNTQLFTVPFTGVYDVGYSIVVGAGGAAASVMASWIEQSSGAQRLAFSQASFNTGSGLILAASDIAVMTAGQSVWQVVYHNHGSDLNIGGVQQFMYVAYRGPV